MGIIFILIGCKMFEVLISLMEVFINEKWINELKE